MAKLNSLESRVSLLETSIEDIVKKEVGRIIERLDGRVTRQGNTICLLDSRISKLKDNKLNDETRFALSDINDRLVILSNATREFIHSTISTSSDSSPYSN